MKATNIINLVTPVFDADGDISVTATFGMPVTIGIGLNVLDGTFERDVSFAATPAIIAKAEASISASLDPSSGGVSVSAQTDSGCAGIDLSLSYEQTLGYNILGLTDGTLYDSGAIPLADYCITLFNGTDTDEATVNSTTGFGNHAGNGTLTYGVAQLTTVEQSGVIIWCNDTDIYWSSLSYSNPSCGNGWVLPNSSVSSNTSVLADSARRLPVYFPNELSKTGASRLQLVSPAQIQKHSEYLVFEYTGSYHAPTNINGTSFQTVSCSIPGDDRHKLFIVSNSASANGLTHLQSTDLEYSISGMSTATCATISMALSPDPLVALIADVQAVANAVAGITSSLSNLRA
jgi:hypothetical protein